MKTLLLTLVVLFSTFSLNAEAQKAKIVGESAESFIDKYFPDAEIPGTVEGFFSYIGKTGARQTAYAKCFSPAMGARSNGTQTGCIIQYSIVTLKGKAAESFIAQHFADAEIPGKIEGSFTYTNRKGSHASGYAKCFYPAMGSRSDGEVTTCSVAY